MLNTLDAQENLAKCVCFSQTSCGSGCLLSWHFKNVFTYIWLDQIQYFTVWFRSAVHKGQTVIANSRLPGWKTCCSHESAVGTRPAPLSGSDYSSSSVRLPGKRCLQCRWNTIIWWGKISSGIAIDFPKIHEWKRRRGEAALTWYDPRGRSQREDKQTISTDSSRSYRLNGN